MLTNTPFQKISSALQSVATGPELSKSISHERAQDVMGLILDGVVDEVQAGIFLIAMRMKRESMDENSGLFQALLNRQLVQTVDCESLITVADPFNGFVRSIPATPFMLPLLAACGLNAYSHGVKLVGPKYGVTHSLLLAAAGIDTYLDLDSAKQQIENAEIGWAYVDQNQYLPSLTRLIALRVKMVKRTALTTYEPILGPFRGLRSCLMTGYVHKAYPPVYCTLARQAGFDDVIVVRGVEGGCIPSLSQISRYFYYSDGGEELKTGLDPKDLEIVSNVRGIPIPDAMCVNTKVDVCDPLDSIGAAESFSAIDINRVAEYGAGLGLLALSGEPGPMRDSLLYGASICLIHGGLVLSWQDAVNRAKSAIDNGDAMARFKAATRTKSYGAAVSL